MSNISENPLSRLHSHMQAHDVAMITAFRGRLNNCVEECNGDCNPDAPITTQENMERNRELKAALMRLGYGIIAVDGHYIENYGEDNAKPVKENTYFVVNLADKPDFLHNIEALGIKYCQDSIFCKPREVPNAYLVGTNNCEWPGLGNKEDLGTFNPKNAGQFFTAIGGRTFTFEASESNKGMLMEAMGQFGRNARMVISSIGEKVLKEANILK